MSQGYDFGQLYGQADMSSGIRIEEGSYPAICVKSEWGRTKGGDKGQWTVVSQITQGQYAGTKFTNSVTISPLKNDGATNERGLGAMFRHLAAHGIPVPAAPGMPGGFWELNWTPEYVAQQMVGKPVTIVVKDDEYEGVTRSKIKDYQPPKPGDPTSVQQAPQQPQAAGYGYAQQAPQQGWQPQQPAAVGPPNGYGAQTYNAGPAYAQQPPQGGPVAPGAWQNAQQPQGQMQGAPDWAQPAQPGAGGMGEFTPQGQSYQPSFMAPGQGQDHYQQATGQMAPGQYQQGPQGSAFQQPPQGPPPAQFQQPQQPGPPQNMGQPAMPGWAQPPAPPQGQPGQPPQQDPGQAPPPPWAQ